MKLLPRIEELSNVFRYEWSPCTPMFYRPNLLIHSRRVEWLAWEISQFLIENIWAELDIELIKQMARFHDDAEIITWDYLSMDKESFSNEKQNEYENDSIKAIDILHDNYGNISEQFDYKQMLLDLEAKKWLEYLIVNFADKLDAHLEVSHELFAWNKMFAIILSNWWLEVWPFDYTKNKLFKIQKEIINHYWKDIDFNGSFLDLDSHFDDKLCLDNSRIHTISMLWENTWYNLYDNWIELHFNNWNDHDINYLVNKREG